MRIAICFLTFVIGYTYATTCSDSQPCDTSLTTCGQGYTLTCTSTGHCVCMGSGGAHSCNNDPANCQSTAQNPHQHQCHGQWECTNNHCHCMHHHGPGGGGPGGN